MREIPVPNNEPLRMWNHTRTSHIIAQSRAAAMFDSDEEDEERFRTLAADAPPLDIQWLTVTPQASLALSSLPGRRFKEDIRSLQADLQVLREHNVSDVFVLNTAKELTRYRVPTLLQEYSAWGIAVHSHPFEDGCAPTVELMAAIAREVQEVWARGGRPLVHCYGGLGRTGLVACVLMRLMQPSMTNDEAIGAVRQLRGPRAIQTVKQYNFINDLDLATLSS
eukprot:m.210393 g.210393  ORF g.210393 m.210393 type:complete len:223 (+) comp17818_c1_seq2:7589-8257(+)